MRPIESVVIKPTTKEYCKVFRMLPWSRVEFYRRRNILSLLSVQKPSLSSAYLMKEATQFCGTSLATRLHGVMSQETVLLIASTVRVSNCGSTKGIFRVGCQRKTQTQRFVWYWCCQAVWCTSYSVSKLFLTFLAVLSSVFLTVLAVLSSVFSDASLIRLNVL
jgi:hypothetical protein